MNKLTYFKQMDHDNYTITVTNGENCLHLLWDARLAGDRWNFQGISITEANLDILKEAQFLKKLTEIPIDIYPVLCERMLKKWGLIEKSGSVF